MIIDDEEECDECVELAGYLTVLCPAHRQDPLKPMSDAPRDGSWFLAKLCTVYQEPRLIRYSGGGLWATMSDPEPIREDDIEGWLPLPLALR